MSWVCPKCERELLKENQTHWCAKISIDSLFTGKPADLILVFDKILAEVACWESVIVSTTPNCVVFVHRKTFFVIKPMQKVLELKFYSNEPIQDRQIVKNQFYQGKYANFARVSSIEEITPQLFKFIRQSYTLL